MRHDPSGVTVSDDLLTLLADFPALDEQGGTLFVADTDRGVANLFDVPETDALMGLVAAVPRLREALLKARTTVERLNRENDGLSARLTETRREHDAEVTLLHDEIAEVRAENDRLRTSRYEDAAGVLAAARADAATWNARATALETERDAARGDLDAVRRVLAEGLATGEDDDLDALALAAKACEAIDTSQARRDETLNDLRVERLARNEARARAQVMCEERNALARGESAPSLDAIRAHEARGGLWLVLYARVASNQIAKLCERGGLVVVNGATSEARAPAEFARAYEGARWWRVAPDGSLAVAEASS